MPRIDLDPGTWPIGRWRFDATDGTLTDGATVRRLEFRATATLAVLCRRRGEVVGRQELLDEVWDGRAVSPNSVAVVIADLRRAMGDDAKAPALLLTVAKRGYRLADEAKPGRLAPRLRLRHRLAASLALGAGVAALAFAVVSVSGGHDRPDALTTSPVRNDTGLAADAPLAMSLGALMVDQLARDGNLSVTAGSAPAAVGGGTPALALSSRLVLWNGLPTLHMLVVQRATGRVVWSAMVVADADHIAAKTIARMAELRRWLAARRGSQG